MAINKLQVGDKLRFEDDVGATIGVFSVVSDDSIEVIDTQGAIDLISPVYGSTYVKFDNPVTARFTKGSVSLEGTKTAFDAIDALISSGMKPVSLVIGGAVISKKTFFRCIVTSVVMKQDLKKQDTWVSGQIGYIKL